MLIFKNRLNHETPAQQLSGGWPHLCRAAIYSKQFTDSLRSGRFRVICRRRTTAGLRSLTTKALPVNREVTLSQKSETKNRRQTLPPAVSGGPGLNSARDRHGTKIKTRLWSWYLPFCRLAAQQLPVQVTGIQ